MASLMHEGVVDLFRNRPELATLLLGTSGIKLPDYEAAEVVEASKTQVKPKEYRADLVIVLKLKGRAVFVVVLEVQLKRDKRKWYTWPVYWASARARWKCPACVVVVCPDANVAEWAARPIDLGAGQTLSMAVLGPNAIPKIDSFESAQQHPELAVLSAIAHKDNVDAKDRITWTILALSGVDEEVRIIYHDLIMTGLKQSLRQAVEEALMVRGKYRFQSEFAREHFALGKVEGETEGIAKGKAEGIAKGKAEAILTVCRFRNVKLSPEENKRLLSCTDSEQLDRWLERAVIATTAADLFGEQRE